jgi:hypothetical protein
MAWAPAEQALALCSTGQVLLPAQQHVRVFTTSSKALQLYEEEVNNEDIYNVRLVGQNGGKVAIAAVDLALHSEWFRAYLRNR